MDGSQEACGADVTTAVRCRCVKLSNSSRWCAKNQDEGRESKVIVVKASGGSKLEDDAL